jgi:hypothetical protein
MLKRSLVQTNPYLRDPGTRRKMFAITVCTSSGVEGVRLTPADLQPSSPASAQPALVRRAGSPSVLRKQPRIRT